MSENNMIEHDQDKTIFRGWHLDKRVSIAHFFATISFAFGLAAIQYAMSERINLNAAHIAQHQKVVEIQVGAMREIDKALLLSQSDNYKEIIRRLERIEDAVARYREGKE